MPIFDYYCKNCDTTVEKMVKSSDVVIECDKCHKPANKVTPNKMSFKLKGRGWFKTGGY